MQRLTRSSVAAVAAENHVQGVYSAAAGGCVVDGGEPWLRGRLARCGRLRVRLTSAGSEVGAVRTPMAQRSMTVTVIRS